MSDVTVQPERTNREQAPIRQLVAKQVDPFAEIISEEAVQAVAKVQIDNKFPNWQERLLPVMVGLLIGLTIFFFLATFVQISYLHWSTLRAPTIDFDHDSVTALVGDKDSFDNRLEALRFDVYKRMEAYVVTQRYHQANALLMSGLWIRYLGFVTGMILSLVGASFVLGKLREPLHQFEGKFSAIDLSLRTTSPGIILVVLGVLLMFTTLVDRDTYRVVDNSVYMSELEVSPSLTTRPFETLLPPSSLPIGETSPSEAVPTANAP